jgi:hypothetical protein
MEGRSYGVKPDSDGLGGHGAGASRSVDTVAGASSLKSSPRKDDEGGKGEGRLSTRARIYREP